MKKEHSNAPEAPAPPSKSNESSKDQANTYGVVDVEVPAEMPIESAAVAIPVPPRELLDTSDTASSTASSVSSDATAESDFMAVFFKGEAEPFVYYMALALSIAVMLAAVVGLIIVIRKWFKDPK